MIKRITAVVLSVIMLFCMFPSAVFAAAETAAVTITADKATAKAGDTITYTVKIKQTGTMAGFEMALVIPDGLTFISGEVDANAKTKLDFDDLSLTGKKLTGFGLAYTGTEEITLMTFQCTVDGSAAAKDYEVKFDELLIADENGEPKASATQTTSKVTVTAPATPKTLSGIAVTKAPTKTAYTAGENFDPAGMEVTATYSDSSTAKVTGFTVTDGTVLTAGKTTVTISYTEGGVVKTATQAITVKATYTVTVTGGTASPAGPYTEGTEVTVTADHPDPEGKKFKEWQIEGLSTTTSESRSVFFYMPANNVTITAIYEDANIIIESASATITEPVVGANPDFNIVSADESKYTVTVVKWNLLDGSSYPVLTAGDKFVRGESYQLDVKFVANPGYEFSDSCVYNVNGVSRAAYSLIKGERRCYFDVYEIIDTINVKGVVAPVAGATPDVSGITSDTDGIKVIDVKWRDKDGYAFEEDQFVAGEKYILWLKYETESDYKVADDAEVTFNISDSNIRDKEITHPIIKMTYEVPAAATYTVSFDANSGTGTMTPVTGVSGEYELPACTFTAPSGKQFKAWSVGGREKAVGEKITVTADTTVTAVWEAVSEYTKKGDVSAVEATATIDPALGATTSSVSFTITDPTDAAAKGVKILGSSWYKKDASSTFGWTQCSNGVDTFGEGTYRLEVQLRSESNDAKEYYAMSSETTFTVNGVQWSGKEQFRDYYASGGYGYRVFVSPEFTLGGKTLDSIAVTTPPTKTVYREGEDFNPAGMVVTATYTDSTTDSVVLYTVTDGTAMAAGKTTVTISYTEGGVTKTTTQTITVAKEYDVTVDGGTGNGKYVAGEEVTISAFVSGGRKFKEWQGTDGLTFTFGDKNSQTATFTMPAHDVTVTAVTGPAEYYVSVTGGSGTGTYETGATVTIVAGAPEAGKQFKTWVVGDGKVLNFTESTITDSTAKFIMPGEAVRIYAEYEVIPATTYTVSFAANGGTGTMADKTGIFGEYELPACTFTAPSGKQFKAWSVGGAEKAVGDKITVTANTTVKAVWENIPVTTYTVSFDANGGTGTMTAATVESGAEYTLPANGFTAPAGKQFKAWSVGGVEKAVGEKITVTANTTVKAVWEDDNSLMDDWYWALIMLYSQKFDITATASEGGEITPEGVTTVQYSKNITYIITPDVGYAIKSVIVDGKDVGAVSEYTFKKVTKKHTIHAVFEQVNPYTDVKADDWFYDDVLYVTAMGLMEGTGNGKFSPEITTDRAMLVTVLWRLEGCPVVDSSVDFDDVADGLWYSDAIDWASANGIVNGYGDGRFGPADHITREQIMAILNRYAAYKGWTDGTALPMLAQYKYSEWAENNVIWAENNGLLDGLGVDVSDMTAKASRAELAAYLHRFMKNIIK